MRRCWRRIRGAIGAAATRPGVHQEDGRAGELPSRAAGITARPEYPLPPSGKFETLAYLDGAAIAGPADVIVEEVRAFHKIGVEHFVFDFRTRFARFGECIEMVSAEVLPPLHRGDGRK
jgi:hypothetical protein